MSRIDEIRNELPALARDIKLNLQAVLADDALSPAQRWGVAVTAAATVRHDGLLDAVVAQARERVSEATVEDALAAAVLMGMNNVYYRFRHLIGKAAYARKPARLRMNRLVHPAATKLDFELYCLAASAINGCETCMRAHEEVVVGGGLSDDAVHDAIRIAATIAAAAMALELPAPATRAAVA